MDPEPRQRLGAEQGNKNPSRLCWFPCSQRLLLRLELETPVQQAGGGSAGRPDPKLWK